MTEDELNAKYIQKITGLKANDKLIPIILSMIKEAYKEGLKQAELDNTMGVIEENSALQYKINEAIEKLYCWGEALDPIFQKEMLLILRDE